MMSCVHRCWVAAIGIHALNGDREGRGSSWRACCCRSKDAWGVVLRWLLNAVRGPTTVQSKKPLQPIERLLNKLKHRCGQSPRTRQTEGQQIAVIIADNACDKVTAWTCADQRILRLVKRAPRRRRTTRSHARERTLQVGRDWALDWASDGAFHIGGLGNHEEQYRR